MLILKDSQFPGEMLRRMRKAPRRQKAITEVVNGYVDLFAKTNSALREKVQDVKDVGASPPAQPGASREEYADYTDEMVITGDLLPSDIVKLATQQAAGLIMVREPGDLPHLHPGAVDGCSGGDGGRRAGLQRPGRHAVVLVDANLGSIFRQSRRGNRPRSTAASAHEERGREVARDRRARDLHPRRDSDPTVGQHQPAQRVDSRRGIKAEGIGLYRSEFPFIVRSDVSLGRGAIPHLSHPGGAHGRAPGVMRTLDIGGDKMLSYYPSVNEANPFLGLRALRFTLRNKDIFVEAAPGHAPGRRRRRPGDHVSHGFVGG